MAARLPPLFPSRPEASLKILEMTSGKIPTLAKTYLGLRHGPISFIDGQTLVLCLISGDPVRRPYELDLIAELHAERESAELSRLRTEHSRHLEVQVDTMAGELPG